VDVWPDTSLQGLRRAAFHQDDKLGCCHGRASCAQVRKPLMASMMPSSVNHLQRWRPQWRCCLCASACCCAQHHFELYKEPEHRRHAAHRREAGLLTGSCGTKGVSPPATACHQPLRRWLQCVPCSWAERTALSARRAVGGGPAEFNRRCCLHCELRGGARVRSCVFAKTSAPLCADSIAIDAERSESSEQTLATGGYFIRLPIALLPAADQSTAL